MRRNQIKKMPAQSLMSMRPSLLQRKCACGAASGLSTCSECSGKNSGASPLAPAHSSLLESSSLAGRTSHVADDVQRSTTPGHNFSEVSIYPEHGGNGDALFINGPDKDTPKTPPKTKTPPPKQKAPAAKAACPTDIQVINIDPIVDKDFGKNGWLTGYGGVAYMQVSGPDRTDWDGTIIKEKVKQTKNNCGARAKKTCSNVSGTNEFEVGTGAKVMGQTKLPALMNTFYDIHFWGDKDASVLHEKGLTDCQVQCEQSFSCGGKQIGPEFIITYSATRDTIANYYDVTRVKVDKSAKASKP